MPPGFSSLTPVWFWCYHTPYHARHDASNIKSPREEQKDCKHEFVAFYVSKKVKVLVTQSCLTLCNPMYCSPPWNSPGKSTGAGCIFFSRGIFLIQGLNLGLLHFMWILSHLSHQKDPIMSLILTPFLTLSFRVFIFYFFPPRISGTQKSLNNFYCCCYHDYIGMCKLEPNRLVTALETHS